MLNKILSFNDRNTACKGYVYVARADDGPMSCVTENAIVRNTKKGPPYIVVDANVSSIRISKWPGRLWYVEIVEPALPKDQLHEGKLPLSAEIYIRAVAVKILREEPLSTLFGVHGDHVIKILQAVENLTRDQAQQLALKRDSKAKFAYNRIWQQWMKQQNIVMQDEGSIGFNHMMSVDRVNEDGTLDGTLEISGFGSPINRGLSILHTIVYDRARTLEGENAFHTAECSPLDAFYGDGEGGILLLDPWKSASRAMADAALALGAPELVGEEDSGILLHSWRNVFD